MPYTIVNGKILSGSEKKAMRGTRSGTKPGDISSKQLEQAAFKAGLEYQIPPEVTAAIDTFLAGTPTFTNDPVARARAFEAEVQGPALRTFEQQIVPEIAQRFVSRGVRGPAQEATLLDAGQNLASNLGALRSQFFRQDEQQEILAKEAALGRVSQGATARLGESILPIQLKAALGGQARGAEAQTQLNSFLQQMIAMQRESASSLQAAIQNAAPGRVFEFGNSGGGGLFGLF
jgi:hypothetical protein